jgi:hypothetical protein
MENARRAAALGNDARLNLPFCNVIANRVERGL